MKSIVLLQGESVGIIPSLEFNHQDLLERMERAIGEPKPEPENPELLYHIEQVHVPDLYLTPEPYEPWHRKAKYQMKHLKRRRK